MKKYIFVMDLSDTERYGNASGEPVRFLKEYYSTFERAMNAVEAMTRSARCRYISCKPGKELVVTTIINGYRDEMSWYERRYLVKRIEVR